MSATTTASPLLDVEVPHLAGEPSWLGDGRRRAHAAATGGAFPSRKEEDWRYTRLDDLLLTPVSLARGPAAEVTDEWLRAHVADLGGPRLVFVDGHLVPGACRVDALPHGVRVESLAACLESGSADVRSRWELAAAEPDHTFAALNAALCLDGVVVDVAQDVALDDPIHVLFLSSGKAEASLSCPRSLVRVGARAAATVVVEHRSLTDFADAAATVTLTDERVELGEGAALAYHVVEAEHPHAFHLADTTVEQAADSTFTSRVFTFGAAVARRSLHVRLAGDGASAELDGLYLPLAGQQHDHPIFVEHLASHGTSRQLYKGVMDGDGHGVFNGRVIVHPDIVGTDAGQSNQNLLLSRHAEADTRPRLEIYAEDVRATHGASVGQLDDDQLFYLRTRGIPEADARLVLTEAFARQLVERVTVSALRDHLDAQVVAHLAASLGAER